MLAIKPHKIKQRCQLTVPGSKSYTHRILVASALSDGLCTIENALFSEDTRLTMAALRQVGIDIDDSGDGRLAVHGQKGALQPCGEKIYLANSGTSMRLLTAVAALGRGSYTLAGSKRMARRPLADLVGALGQIGITAHCENPSGCPPVHIRGGTPQGGPVDLDCRTSSQYLSALLLIAPYTRNGLDITVTAGPVSKPYVDMTVGVMEKFGVTVSRQGYEHFSVSGRQVYRARSFTVEADCSQAGYFWAAAAITGSQVKVCGLDGATRQGDVRLTQILESMGCHVLRETDGIQVCGHPLQAVTVNMSDMPDVVPTLAVVAAFAAGTTVIHGVAHLRAKESDRLAAVVAELKKMGIRARCDDGILTITGGRPRGTEIETYDDHRIAMSFAVAGLKAPGTVIHNEGCVEKSFPRFWQVFETLYA